MTELPFPVRAGEFEGPLDLLLALVREHEVKLEDFPIAEVTSQYLRYLQEAEAARIELGAEFIYMAATLIYNKSRMLLPVDPALAPGAAADPKRELIDRLREHMRAREAAQSLQSRLEVEENTWSNPGIRDFLDAWAEDPPVTPRAGERRATLADLIDTLSSAVERAKTQARLVLEADAVTVEERLTWYRERVIFDGWGRRRFVEIVEGQGRLSAVCVFLALLELAKRGEVSLESLGEDVLVEPTGIALPQ
jgi:segregation and condensation protein A